MKTCLVLILATLALGLVVVGDQAPPSASSAGRMQGARRAPLAPLATPSPTPSTPTPTACVPATWTAGAAFPGAVAHAAGVYFPATGKFDVLGGSGGSGSYLNPHEYDPVVNTWITKTATFTDSQVIDMACGMLTTGGAPAIYCAGGAATGQASATSAVRRYDPVADQLTVITSDPWPGDANGTTLPGGFTVANDKLYILGGFNINVAATNQIWEFDPNGPAGSRWTQKVNAPAGIMSAPAAAVNGIIYVAGASDYQGGTIIDTTDSFSFNPAANTLGTILAIPRATGETRAVNVGGTVWVLGGGRVAPNPSNEVDVYNPTDNSWTTGPPLTSPRRSFPADSDGRCVWLVGGIPVPGPAWMEIYCPPLPCTTLTATPTAPPTGTPAPPTPTPMRTNTPLGPPTGTPAPPTPTPGGPTATAPATATLTATPYPPSPTDTPCAISFADVHPADYFSPPTPTPGGPTATAPATATLTATPYPPSPTDTPCAISFADVHPADYFYTPVRDLACHGVLSGYADGTLRPYNQTTRAQMVKIVVLGFQIPSYAPSAGYSFEDVPPANPFFGVIETAAHNNVVSGYACGGP